MNRRIITLASILAAGLAACTPAWSQAYPAKPVRFIVPTPPAGAVDLVARLVGQKLGDALGQPSVIENRPNTVGASEAVARAAPDGYLLLVANSTTHVSNVHLIRNLPYDPLRDFTPLVGAVDTVAALVAHPSVPGGSIRDLIDHAKANPGKLTYGSSGPGSAFHVAGELFESSAGVDLLHVPYKGLAPAMADVLSGQISMAFTALSVAMPHVKAGKVKLLAIVGGKRHGGSPQVPALTEAAPGFVKPSLWTGFVGPAGMNAAIASKLNAEMNKALNAPDVRGKLEGVGLEVMGGSAEQFAALMRRDIESYGKIVKTLGLKPE